MNDNKNIEPKHYTDMVVSPLEFIKANGLSWNAGNVIKYVSRYPLKNGVEDVMKALWYLNDLIKDKEDDTYHYTPRCNEDLAMTPSSYCHRNKMSPTVTEVITKVTRYGMDGGVNDLILAREALEGLIEWLTIPKGV